MVVTLSKVSNFQASEIWSKNSFDQSKPFTPRNSSPVKTALFEGSGLTTRLQAKVPLSEPTEAQGDDPNDEDDLILPAAPLEEEPEYVQLESSELEKLLADAEKKGRDAAKDELHARTENEIVTLKETLGNLIVASSAAINDKRPLVEELTKLSLRIGQLLARLELSHSSEKISQFIRQLLNQITDEDTVDISLMHPEEWSEAIDGLNLAEEFPNVKFRSDDSLPVGSVIMHYGNGGLIDLFEERADRLQTELTAAVYEHSKPSTSTDQAFDLASDSDTSQVGPESDG